MTEMVAARCPICGDEFIATMGPESYSLGKYMLGEHLRSKHHPETVIQVYALHTPWYETDEMKNS